MKFNAKVKVAKKPVRVVKVAVKKIAKKPVVVKKTVKKPGVGKHYEKIAENKSLYGRRIKQLKAITDDTNYIPKRGTTGTNLENSYHEKVVSTLSRLINRENFIVIVNVEFSNGTSHSDLIVHAPEIVDRELVNLCSSNQKTVELSVDL